MKVVLEGCMVVGRVWRMEGGIEEVYLVFLGWGNLVVV